MESLARKYWKDKDKIAKLTSYGSYLDCEYITAKYPDDESHIVGDLAEYIYDLEQEIEELNHKLNVEQPCLLMNYKDMVDMLKKSQNQTAIAELEKARKVVGELLDNCGDKQYKVWELFDQQIKSLKGGK